MTNSKEGSAYLDVAMAALDRNVRIDLRMPARDALVLVFALDQAQASGLLKAEDRARIDEVKKNVLAKAKLDSLYATLREHTKQPSA